MSQPKLDNPLEALAGYQLRRASSAQMESLSRRLEAHGLRPTEASMLVLVGANPGVKQTELGRCLGVQRANMAPLTASLEKRGLIAREAVDGRSQGLSLSPAGLAARDAALNAMAEHDAELKELLGVRSAEELKHSLAALWDSGAGPAPKGSR